jgi:hypothetical protein
MYWFKTSAALAALCFSFQSLSFADQIAFTSVPAGYNSGTLELGAPFAGALCANPADTSKIYVAIGSYLNESIALVDTVSQTTSVVATGFGAIGGIAVLGNGDLVVTENATSDTIFRLRDQNSDGDFLDAGEVSELIAPILADGGNFTGAQITVAPAGNAAAIPAGALLLQTADDNTSSELLVIENPETAPAYRPAGGAFFSGFQFNGGIAFDSAGNVIMGESTFDWLTFTSSGRIYALVNSNANETIDSGESHIIVGPTNMPAGLSDLAVSAENAVFFTESSGNIRTFALPLDLLNGSATPSGFATTDAGYLSVCRFNDPMRNFAAGSPGPHARLYVGGWTSSWTPATNLLWLEPTPASSVEEWSLF